MVSDAVAGPEAPVRRWQPVEAPVPVLLGAGAVVVALTVAGRLLGQTGPTPGTPSMTATMAVAFTPLGVFVSRRLPGHPLGRLMVLAGLAAALNALAVSWSALLVAAWLSQWTWWVPWALVPIVLLLFPDGQLPSPRWRPLLVVLVGAAVVGGVSLAAAAVIRPRTLLTEVTTPLPPAALALLFGAGGAGAVLLLATLGVLVALLVRWRRAVPLVRRQLVCLLPAGVLLAVGLVLEFQTEVPEPWLPAVVALPLGLTFAVLRYRFADLDLYVHRGSVWIVLTALAVAVYAATVSVVSGTLVRGDSPWVSLLGAGAVAALLQPAERLARRGVSRLLYGRRDDPYAVVTELGRHLGTVRDPLAVLPRIASTVVDGLRVPYAAIRITAADGTTSTVAEEGRWRAPERFALVAHGEPVGELLVAPRLAGGGFTGAETRLLHDLAAQAAVAVEACRSAVALAQARDRLVLAREEERRRLRRDLHDGVASALVGTRMLAQAVRRSVPVEGAAPELLDTLSANLEGCSAEVRDLIDGLRPAALDHGLGPALDGLVSRFGDADGAPAVSLTVEGDLTELPAAVEVVAYRVVAESLTNVVKHARAAFARVEVRRDERHLDVRVTDDGVGLGVSAGSAGSGVGLSSIRERVDELGGRCSISAGPAGRSGTRVEVLLPVAG
jgi:two-component system NarL family sensor kinase